MKEDLLNIGCTPRKTETLNFPKNIPNTLIIHFIRGYFDGDGCLSFVTRKGIRHLMSSFIGTKNILLGIQRVLGLSQKLHKASHVKNSSDFVFEFKIAKKDSVKILNILYNDSSIYLERKYKRFSIFKENNYAVPTEKSLE